MSSGTRCAIGAFEVMQQPLHKSWASAHIRPKPDGGVKGQAAGRVVAIDDQDAADAFSRRARSARPAGPAPR
jgi:hypothetical protein